MSANPSTQPHLYVRIHPADNVLVALTDLPEGSVIQFEGQAFTLPGPVPVKHKFPLSDLLTGDPVFMYGVLVGRTTSPVPRGGWLNTSNLKNDNTAPVLSGKHIEWNATDVSKWADRTFQGYHRSDGSVGTANYWLVVPLVFCENRNLERMREALLGELGYLPQHPIPNWCGSLKNSWLERRVFQ